jgi:hypothetical protein
MGSNNYDRNDLTVAFIYGMAAGVLLVGAILGILNN